MNNGQKGKSFERWDRDGVAQHRNLMHEIAMKKQITMYQREEKLLAKELREISKVKETLLQIRAPLRRRVQAAELEENLESLGNEGRNSRKTSVTTRKISVAANTSAQQKCTKDFGSAHGEGTSGINQRTLTTSVSDGYVPLSSVQNTRQRKISVLEKGQRGLAAGNKLATQRKISAPAFIASKTPISEKSDKGGFLPAIKTPKPPIEGSPSLQRISPILDRPLSAPKTEEVVECRNRSPTTLTPIAPSRVDMAVLRAKSVPCDLPSHYAKTSKSRQRVISDTDEVTTLTMEETLRIKGKFRQIGHSVIAAALLKGLKQSGQLSSEAIHNMHKPISFTGEVNGAKAGENKDVEAEAKEDGQEEEEVKQGNNKKSFRSLARKTININRLINAKSSSRIRGRSQSDPPNTSNPKSSLNNPGGITLNQAAEAETAVNNSAQPKDSRPSQVGARIRRMDSAGEFQLDTNSSREENESDNNVQTQQMYRKQSAVADPFRPLMNPRTAHARRRKNTFSGEPMEVFEKTQNNSLDTEPQGNRADTQTTGNKTVRFAAEAWS